MLNKQSAIGALVHSLIYEIPDLAYVRYGNTTRTQIYLGRQGIVEDSPDENFNFGWDG
ncbi:hypothetical protein Sjap_010394 [Stephania japonica]|uniref:Uncharacterized protein n=1 Tax=Stephania japonica TaxID=461633 RepID=A0AAP0P3L2_9MAGN